MIAFATTCDGGSYAAATSAVIGRDLYKVTVPQLQRYYTEHKYSVTQVVPWHLARIYRYDGIYRAIEVVMDKQALAEVAHKDAEAAQGSAARGSLWGVPIIIKANTSIAGEFTTNGWNGYKIHGARARGAARSS